MTLQNLKKKRHLEFLEESKKKKQRLKEQIIDMKEKAGMYEFYDNQYGIGFSDKEKKR
jgi:hypothetical protein